MSIKSIKNNTIRIIKKIPIEVYIFIVAIVYRIPTLGYDFINNDAYHWKERGYAFGEALTSLDFAGTAVTYHPGVPLLWSQFVAIKIYTILDMLFLKGAIEGKDLFLINHQIQKFTLVVITSFLIALLYNVLKKIIGKSTALIVIVIVLLEPFYLGLSRAIHNDVLLSLFMFLSVVFFYLGCKSEKGKIYKNWNLVFAGLFAGLAYLTKSSALFLIPFLGLVSIYLSYVNKSKLPIYKYGFALLISVATFIIVWPAMWVQPFESINLYIRKGVQGVALEEGHGHIWFGKVTQDPGALFYPVVFAARYSEFLFITFFIGVGYFAYKAFSKKDESKITFDKNFVLINLMYIVFYVLMITLVSKKLDRYLLPTIFSIATISAVYLNNVLRKKWLVILLLCLILYRGILLWAIHPNYLAYYNPMIGGIDDGRYIVEPKWLIGYDQVAMYFNEKQEEKDRKINVAIADFDYLEPFARFNVINIKHEVERNEAEFFVLPVYREERNQFYKSNYDLERLDDSINIAGVKYYEIYLNKGKKEE